MPAGIGAVSRLVKVTVQRSPDGSSSNDCEASNRQGHCASASTASTSPPRWRSLRHLPGAQPADAMQGCLPEGPPDAPAQLRCPARRSVRGRPECGCTRAAAESSPSRKDRAAPGRRRSPVAASRSARPAARHRALRWRRPIPAPAPAAREPAESCTSAWWLGLCLFHSIRATDRCDRGILVHTGGAHR